MAAPTPAARVAPTGDMLREGYKSTFTFSRDTDCDLYEIDCEFVGIDNGDPINCTTMHTTGFEVMAPQAISSVTPAKMSAGYDPVIWNQIVNGLVGQEGTITQTWPDGSTLAYYGYLKSWKPNGLKRGELPLCDVEVVCTNWDFTNDVYAAPVLTAVAGT